MSVNKWICRSELDVRKERGGRNDDWQDWGLMSKQSFTSSLTIIMSWGAFIDFSAFNMDSNGDSALQQRPSQKLHKSASVPVCSVCGVVEYILGFNGHDSVSLWIHVLQIFHIQVELRTYFVHHSSFSVKVVCSNTVCFIFTHILPSRSSRTLSYPQ